MGKEMDDAHLRIEEELPYQAFPETATWGLRYHEEKYGLPVRENLTYEERRRLILEKRNTRAPHESIYDGKNTGKYNRKKDSCK